MPFAYLSLTFLLAFAPGATTAMVVRHTLIGGRRRGLTVAAGAAAGNLTQAAIALVGVSALIASHPSALRILSMLGALFLGFIGLKSLIRSLGSLSALSALSALSEPSEPGPAFLNGLGVNLLNPSITGFYVGVVPSFVPAGAPWRVAALFYLAHVGIAFVCHGFWASVFHRARLWFAGERPRRWLDAAVGIVLLWLAVRLLARSGVTG